MNFKKKEVIEENTLVDEEILNASLIEDESN